MKEGPRAVGKTLAFVDHVSTNHIWERPVAPRFAGMERPVPIPVPSLALQICPLAVSSPELPLGTVQETQDWLVHPQPHKDAYRMHGEPIPYARKCSLERCTHGFKLGCAGFTARTNTLCVEIPGKSRELQTVMIKSCEERCVFGWV